MNIRQWCLQLALETSDPRTPLADIILRAEGFLRWMTNQTVH